MLSLHVFLGLSPAFLEAQQHQRVKQQDGGRGIMPAGPQRVVFASGRPAGGAGAPEQARPLPPAAGFVAGVQLSRRPPTGAGRGTRGRGACGLPAGAGGVGGGRSPTWAPACPRGAPTPRTPPPCSAPAPAPPASGWCPAESGREGEARRGGGARGWAAVRRRRRQPGLRHLHVRLLGASASLPACLKPRAAAARASATPQPAAPTSLCAFLAMAAALS